MTVRHPQFLIVGTSRSGTTLVQRLACELPGVTVPPETHFLNNFALGLVARRRFPIDGSAVIQELQRYLELPSCRGLDLAVDLVVERLGGRCGSVFELFAAVVAELAGDAAIVGEKTPEHLLWWRPLTAVWPGLRFVAVVRDPRAVVASNLDVPFGMAHVELLAERWAADQREVAAVARAVGDRLLLLRYEEVVADPEAARRRLAAFLDAPLPAGVPVTPDPADGAAPGLYHEWETWKDRVGSAVTTERVEAWRTRLTRRQVALVEGIARAEMAAAGYGDVPAARALASVVRLDPPAQLRRTSYRRQRRALLQSIAATA